MHRVNDDECTLKPYTAIVYIRVQAESIDDADNAISEILATKDVEYRIEDVFESL